MWLADLVHWKGFGLWFARSIQAWMAFSRSPVDLWTPRRIWFWVSKAKKRSIWLTHGEAGPWPQCGRASPSNAVGVQWTCRRGRLANQSLSGDDRIAGQTLTFCFCACLATKPVSTFVGHAPVADQLGLVGCAIVHDKVDIAAFGDIDFNLSRKLRNSDARWRG